LKSYTGTQALELRDDERMARRDWHSETSKTETIGGILRALITEGIFPL